MGEWAIIGCDASGVTVEKTGSDPEALADAVASWAQQEEDRWPQMGLLYMLIAPDEVPAARALEAATATPDPSPERRLMELTDRDLELIEVALESAISATESPFSVNDSAPDLNREYRQALARVERLREQGTS